MTLYVFGKSMTVVSWSQGGADWPDSVPWEGAGADQSSARVPREDGAGQPPSG